MIAANDGALVEAVLAAAAAKASELRIEIDRNRSRWPKTKLLSAETYVQRIIDGIQKVQHELNAHVDVESACR